MLSTQESFRFSGHDTFHCKEQWILKGLQLIEDQGGMSIFKSDEAIPILGVGKNMVRSIQHWLRSFGLVDSEDRITDFANKIFLGEKLDPFLENEGSLWLLQYHLCASNHSSIFKLIFSTYFSDKATLDFSEFQIRSFVNRKRNSEGLKEIAEKTLTLDFKVFIRTYVSPVKNNKTVEEDFDAPLLGLNLVVRTGRKNSANQLVYRLNRGMQRGITPEVFGYCLLNEFGDRSAVNYDEIRLTLGAYLCLSNEGLEFLIDKLCNSYREFVYKDDAGIRQIQFKKNTTAFKNSILKKHYGLQ